jgi:hypothetical protein
LPLLFATAVANSLRDKAGLSCDKKAQEQGCLWLLEQFGLSTMRIFMYKIQPGRS